MEIIFLSSALRDAAYGKSVYKHLTDLLPNRIHTLNNGCEWVRDYMPVRIASGQWVQFVYAPEYHTANEKATRPAPENYINYITGNIKYSALILDGGMIEVIDRKAMVTDQVFEWNSGTAEEIYQTLMDDLEVDELILIPTDPYDEYGHLDAMVRFVDENTVVVNDFQMLKDLFERDSNYYRKRRCL